MRSILHYRPQHVVLLLLISINLVKCRTQTSTRSRVRTFAWRGGACRNESVGNAAVEEYVAAMKEKDNQDRQDETPSSADSFGSGDEPDHGAPSAPEEEDDEPAIVGVKAHPSKLSGAVGDPEDDSDDSDDDTSDFSEEWEELQEFGSAEVNAMAEPQVQVEVEMLEDEGTEDVAASASNGGVGVGVRLGRMNNRRKNRKEWRPSPRSPHSAQLSDDQTHLLHAWLPHVYFPPTSKALAYLADNARLMDAASKSRLDRRTLYASLLSEWGCSSSNGGNKSSQSRKFFPPATTQALHAALSMATQPQWRQSSPRISGIRLYQDGEYGKSCTLAMQETVAMALAHSLGCGLLMLDDNVINSVRQQMSRRGLSQEELKPAALIQSLLAIARKGKLSHTTGAGTISSCMERDLSLGLDDPHDDRAAHSCEDMVKWEGAWIDDEASKGDVQESDPLPLVVFIRTTASNSLLKSKSAMELLIQECTSSDTIHLITLGKGVDASTKNLPREVVLHDGESFEGQTKGPPPGSPMFGFSPQNQNASGQNDPEGSRRFNIFLARTVDPNGIPGILGAVAPPQAGNLFPHMMAMQGRARLQNQDENSPAKAELEKWSQLLSQQMQQNGGMSMPPPQFFNASLGISPFQIENGDGEQPPPPPPEVIEQTLQQAMSEMLDRLAQMNEEEDESSSSSEYPNDLHKAFAQVLRNDNLRRGILENLARAAPALSDPKCQGVMLSVYVPPPQHHLNGGSLPGPQNGTPQNNSMGGWFQNVLQSQEDEGTGNDEERKQKRQKRVRTAAAAAAVMAANQANNAKENGEKSSENKAERNLVKLESICRPIAPGTPPDPVRAKSWESWIMRERGSVIFRKNRKLLNDQLALRKLELQQHTGTRGAGSALRQMLSVRDLDSEMEEVIKCAVELEAAKSLRKSDASESFEENILEKDVSLSQLVLSQDGSPENSTEESVKSSSGQQKKLKKGDKGGIQFVHPSSLETALSMKCHISPSPSGGLSLSSSPASHRSREEIAALAQDKHERALVSQVVSPQDIGVTYDMIGGLSNVKELLRQSITYPLKFPHLYSEGIAREAVKGVLLFGPPGTGKTMLAKAVATEGGASFLSVDASSVENKWLGESEKNAKAVFTLARRLAPCVIFIDEVDSLLSSREGSSDDSAHGTLTSVKTTMMSEWDGLNSGTNGNGESGSDRVVVIGSTNRPFDLDEAVLRRFPRRILVDLPDLETRTEILEVTLSENRLDPAVNLTQIAERLEGYTGSDLKEVCREAVVQISHEQAKLLDQGLANGREEVTEGSLQRLRPVTKEDFENALRKLKRSVSENGRELARVWEWNDEYGEIKKQKANHLPHLMNMYL